MSYILAQKYDAKYKKKMIFEYVRHCKIMQNKDFKINRITKNNLHLEDALLKYFRRFFRRANRNINVKALGKSIK